MILESTGTYEVMVVNQSKAALVRRGNSSRR
jgi:hypothetical protein